MEQVFDKYIVLHKPPLDLEIAKNLQKLKKVNDDVTKYIVNEGLSDYLVNGPEGTRVSDMQAKPAYIAAASLLFGTTKGLFTIDWERLMRDKKPVEFNDYVTNLHQVFTNEKWFQNMIDEYDELVKPKKKNNINSPIQE